MVFECPVENCSIKRTALKKINTHILKLKYDPLHAPHAKRLLTCQVCQKVLKSSQGRSNHELAHRNRTVIHSSVQHLQALSVGLHHTSFVQSFPPVVAVNSSTQRPQQLSVGRPHISVVQLLPPAATLVLAILCTLDTHDIPEIILCRLRKDRTCWGGDGEVEHVAVPVFKSLVDLLAGRQFDSVVQCLISFELIESASGALGKRNFTVKPHVRDHVNGTSRDKESRKWLCIVLICHAFPGRREEIGFGDSARVLMPQVRHLFSHWQNLIDQIVRCPDVGYGITLTLLLSSYVSDRQWKVLALELVGKILSCGPQFGKGKTLYLHKLRAQRARDISCRLPHTSIESLCEEQSPIDQRTNALHGEYLRSNAQEILMNKNMTTIGSLSNAYQESSKFRSFTNVLSEMEEREEFQHEYFRGKLRRWNGQFRIAIDHFDRLYNSKYFTFNENGCNIIGHLVGALCEQGELDGAETVTRQALDLLEQVEQEKDLKRKGSMSYRHLQLSLAETLICKTLAERANVASPNEEVVQKLTEAEHILQSLTEGYELSRSQRGLTWGYEINYLRVCMGKALISYLQDRLEESFDRWVAARKHADFCKTVVTIFVPMIIDYIQCDINRRLGKWVEAAILLERAQEAFNVTGREHWWTCYGTLLLDILMTSIPNSGINRMDVEYTGWIR